MIIRISIAECIAFGISNPFIHRAFQENINLFWFTVEDFFGYVAIFVIMHLLSKMKYKKKIFDNFAYIFIITSCLDFASLTLFWLNRSYLQLLIVDMIIRSVYIIHGAVFIDIKASLVSGVELANYSRDREKYIAATQIISKLICMVIATKISGNLIKFEFVCALELILCLCNIVFQFLHYRIYKRSIKSVYAMWENETVNK